MLPFKRRISAAHDALSEVLEAMRQVPLHLLLDGLAGGHARVDLQDIIETVELMGDGGGEDGVFVAFDWMREIVVV